MHRLQEHEAFLMEALQEQPVIDSHSHLPPESTRLNPNDVLREYTGQYVGHDLISAGMPKAAYASLSDLSIPLLERYARAAPFLHGMCNTGYGQCLDRTVRGLLCPDGLTEATLADCDAAFQRTLYPGYYDDFLAPRCHIEHCIVDHTDMAWPYQSQGFVQAYNVVHMITPFKQAIFDSFSQFAGLPIRGFDGYLDACRAVLARKAAEQGVHILKFPVAYQRELSFPAVGHAVAEREFEEVFAGRIAYRDAVSPGFAFDKCPGFQSYMVHFLLAYAERQGFIVQFHTGYLAGNAGYLPNARPTGLIPLLFRYPDLRFDLFHMGYPYYLELAAMAKTYPNAYVNLCWGHILSPNTAVLALREYLDTVPLGKIIGFGSDTRIADTVYGHVQMAKENIARALATRIAEGKTDREEALSIAAELLLRNPKRLYAL